MCGYGVLQDVNNPDSDPEAFAKRLCEDLELQDPEIAVRFPLVLETSKHHFNPVFSLFSVKQSI